MSLPRLEQFFAFRRFSSLIVITGFLCKHLGVNA